MEAWETSCREADERLAAARADLSVKLEAWAGRWVGDEPYAAITAGQAGLLSQALDSIGEPDAPSLAELFGTLTAERGRALTARGERLKTRDADLAAAAARLAEERETVAGERDDGPPASDLRPASRAERAGAPFWQLADFRAGVDAGTAAAIEGALYGAGLLTAWVHPDPAHDRGGGRRGRGRRLPGRAAARGATGRPDPRRRTRPRAAGHGRPGPGRGGARVDRPVRVEYLSESVLSESVLSGEISAAAVPVVTTRAQFSYGPHLGARPKAAPEFIGATNRAARRRIRVAELDRRIAEVKRQRDELAAELSLVDEALANLELAQRELPRTAPVTEARQKVSEAAAHLSAARSRLRRGEDGARREGRGTRRADPAAAQDCGRP